MSAVCLGGQLGVKEGLLFDDWEGGDGGGSVVMRENLMAFGQRGWIGVGGRDERGGLGRNEIKRGGKGKERC